MKPTAKAVAEMAVQRAKGDTILYSSEDCKTFVEQCVRKCGGSMSIAGSNDLVRNHCVWLGTLSNAKKEGKLVPGALLLMWREESEKLPAKYRGDGLGDFYHVGIKVADAALGDVDKNGHKRACDVVHSSQSMGRVAGSTLKNGWTHVMWANEIDYGEDAGGVNLSSDAEEIINEESDPEDSVVNNEGEMVAPAKNKYIQVVSLNGKPVRIREGASHSAINKKGFEAEVGTRFQVLGEKNGFYRVMFRGKSRWIDAKFTEEVE
uniref:Uncharacterized protein n=2 Tax=unclassified Caudoviricetes TaxID=2788787 RepID=A0A8S5Q8S6_9CAUD|nr:MAG TPA: hypothetical protein [Siphoviridae sp. ctAvK3]DAE15203.1 MAG TPA: hypothetical protein [Siphoviridae sp. ctdVv30]